ncbi:Lrp/AsnC family transcriptional regulator [Candidatus Poriferisodalis sp.]|uniref:Lrp/AsnC family transcriptional regulator n=1 Tax=Candidatus Poriferisodalis sp. TaxID=3101277 RepID=UPI003B01A9A3
MIDATDLRILRLLHQDSRASYRSIADILDVSPGTVRNRINQMRSSGLVDFYARFDHEQLGFGVHAFLILNAEPTAKDDISAALLDLDETGLVATLAGQYEVLVEIYCRDVAHLLDLIDKRVQTIAGVTRVSMNLVTATQHGNWPNAPDAMES